MIGVLNLTKIYDHKGLKALDRLSFKIPLKTISIITGPSGAGKSTLMKLMAQVEQPCTGQIQGVQNFAYLSQEWELPEEQTLIDFLEKMAGEAWPTLYPRMRELVELFHLQSKTKLKMGSLSTGQKSRAYLVSKLLLGPEIIFLDEPFAHLDNLLRKEVEKELREVQQQFGLTIIMISHELSTAFEIADHILFIKDGRLVCFESPHEFYQLPLNADVALLSGGANLISSQIKRREASYLLLKNDLGEFRIPLERCSAQLKSEAEFAYLFFRYHQVNLQGKALTAKIVQKRSHGELVDLELRLKNGYKIWARTWSTLKKYDVGEVVGIDLPHESLQVLPV